MLGKLEVVISLIGRLNISQRSCSTVVSTHTLYHKARVWSIHPHPRVKAKRR